MTVAIANPRRHLHLDGCFNFRDLGGYAGEWGRTVRWRRLFRADGPHDLTPQDGDALNELGLRSVIDLRAPSERHASYVDSITGARCHALPMVDLVPGLDELAEWSNPAFVATRYRDMFESGTEAIIEVVAILTDPNAAPAVVHCSAGKDRTGIVSALLLGLLGVEDDTIVADYALSARPMRRFSAWLLAQYPDDRERLRRAVPALVAAEPVAMRRFLDGLRSDYGSLSGWAAANDVDSAIPFLRASFLERS